MPRFQSAANRAASQADHVMPVTFAQLEFDSGTMYLHNSIGPIVTLGQTWTGMGSFGGVEGVEEGAELSPYAIRLSLSVLDAALLSADLTESYWGRKAVLYQGWFDPTSEQLVDDPERIWEGEMDDMAARIGQDDAIYLTCESDFSRIDSPNNKLMSHAEQQTLFPGDLFFEFLAETVDAKVRWGGESAAGAGFRGTPGPLLPGGESFNG